MSDPDRADPVEGRMLTSTLRTGEGTVVHTLRKPADGPLMIHQRAALDLMQYHEADTVVVSFPAAAGGEGTITYQLTPGD